MIKATKRQLAARFVDALETLPLQPAAVALVGLAHDIGYDNDDLKALVAAVEQELLTRFGVAEIQVTTAHDMPASALGELAAQIARQAELKHFSYQHTTDPNMLGGFEAKAGELAIRASVKSQLDALGAARG